MSELKELAKKLPSHIVCEKALWVGRERVEINHIDNDLTKPLDYVNAFKIMLKRLTPEPPNPDNLHNGSE